MKFWENSRMRALPFLSLAAAIRVPHVNMGLFDALTSKAPRYGPPVVIGEESLMSQKAHGTSDVPVQKDLRWNCGADLEIETKPRAIFFRKRVVDGFAFGILVCNLHKARGMERATQSVQSGLDTVTSHPEHHEKRTQRAAGCSGMGYESKKALTLALGVALSQGRG